MSKRALKKYLTELPKKDLEEQMMDLYTRFPVVKEYYDFVFNPKEEKLLQQAKSKISNEYFPIKRRKAKARRSTAQKFIKHFIKLGVDAHLIADLMLFNIEIAQTFEAEKNVADSFYKSMLNSFTEAVHYISLNGLLADYKERIVKVYTIVQEREWLYLDEFSKALDFID
ncbi:DUF6155 family protein [Aurantibacter sp.]|uniref:DUF6155 family protein n=1 Tax=Aurantibacter sp. TaxID=2807103 RepID=UPI003264CDE4